MRLDLPPSTLRIRVVFSGSRSSTIASSGGPLGLNLSPLAAMFLAPFSSLSSIVPQCGHHSFRRVLSRVLYPHIEHRLDVLLAGTWTTWMPSHFALYSICRCSSPKLQLFIRA